MPYVTEEVWRALPHRGETLMNQPWPRLRARTHEPSVNVRALRAVVRACETRAREYAVEPARRVPRTSSSRRRRRRRGLPRWSALAPLGMLAGLARLDEATSSVAASPPARRRDPGAFVQCVVSESVEVWLPLAGIVDPAKETERLGKQAAKLEKGAAGLAGRLASPPSWRRRPPRWWRRAEGTPGAPAEQLQAVETRMEQMAALL